MWQCPLCGKEHGEETLCSCGWSRTKDYLNYNTLCVIGDREKEELSELFFGSEYALTRGIECQNRGDWAEAVDFYKKAAEKGNAEAVKRLGMCFWKGLGTEQNLYRALRLYSKLMEDGEEDVSDSLEAIYKEIRNGQRPTKDETKIDFEEAVNLYYQIDMRQEKNFEIIEQKFQKAAEEGIPLAHAMLGLLYWRTFPYDLDHIPKAVEYLRYAMENEYPIGGVWLAEILIQIRKAEPGYMPERPENKSTQAALFGKVVDLAEAGNAEALYWIGTELYFDEEYEEAVKWLIQAAEQNMPQALGYLGKCYFFGNGVSQDDNKAFQLFKQAERCGAGWIYRYLGDCFYNGYGTEKDTKEAWEYYQQGVEKKDKTAIIRAGDMLDKGEERVQSKKLAFQMYQIAAELGSMDGKRKTGICFWKGNGVEKSSQEAERYFRQAVQMGDNRAKLMLGILLLEKRKGEPDQKTVREIQGFFRDAAENKIDTAYIWAAKINLIYNVDEKYYKEGYEWLKKALDQDVTKAEAMDLMGTCLAAGIGVEKNIPEAVEWFKKAAENNEPKGCLHLSDCYKEGIGVRKSTYEAERWRERAAKAGNSQAALQIAKSTQKRYKALESSHDQVKKYAEIAYQKGEDEAGVILAKNCWYIADYSSKMTKDEKAELYQKAEYYFAEAEKKGVSNARAERANFYLHRFRHKKTEEGIVLLKEEAEKKKAVAQYYLGVCYMKGIGVKKDKKLGKSYIRLAAQAGLEEAKVETGKWLMG